MHCTCGVQLGNVAFCTNCGRSAAAQAPQQVQYQQPAEYQQPYQQQAPWQSYPPAKSNDTNGLSIGAFVFGGIGLIILPIVFGVAGIIMVSVAKSRGERLANAALGVAIAATVLSMLLGAPSYALI